jgi:cytochrome c oxidase cbb3-type subunit I
MEGVPAPMTLNRNPKKSRPYDEPPKRRRSLIPGAVDSAASGFLVAALVWLVVATGIGALALAMRIVPFSLAIPLGVFDLGVELDLRRVEAAFANATVFGWLSNAGFAAIAFMTPRLFGRPLAGERVANVALAIWNLSLAGGIVALYVFDLGPNAALTAMPWLFTGGLAFAALLLVGGFLATAGAGIRSGYISTWFAGVALLSLAGLLGASATLGLAGFFIDLPPLTVALVSVFVERAVVTLWLLGITFAILHYVVPRATGFPLASAGLAVLTFLAWLAFAPLSALAELRDAQVPVAVTTLGSTATILLLVPASLALVNLAQSMSGRWTGLFAAGALAFAAASAVFLLGTALLEAIGSVNAVRTAVAGTEWERGVFLWATYGTFTLAALGLAEHALPRVLRRAYGSGPLSSGTLWLVFWGTTLAGIALMGAGLAEGSLLAAGTQGEELNAQLLPYRVAAFLGFGLTALGALAALVNLFVLYTSAERVEYAVPGGSAAAPASH